MPLWSDSFLTQLAEDAISQINIDINCIYARECIATTIGLSVYTLPEYVRTLKRVTWRGKSLDPMSWEEMTLLTPATAFLSPGNPNNIQDSISRPLYYSKHPTNPFDIKLYPVPNESFTTNGEPNPYAPQVNSPSCIIDHWREPDTTESNPVISLPPYIARRTKKAFVLWKAFQAEGDGQNLRASAFYAKKYQFLIERFRAINSGCFIAKKYAIDDGMLDINGFRYPKPILPSNYERIIY